MRMWTVLCFQDDTTHVVMLDDKGVLHGAENIVHHEHGITMNFVRRALIENLPIPFHSVEEMKLPV